MGSPLAKRVLGWGLALLPYGAVNAALRNWRGLRQAVAPGRDHLYPEYLGQFTVCIDTRYPIERRMWAGRYEKDITRVIQRFAPPGGVCLDIGANVGALTLVMASAVGLSGRVHAFEPGPTIHRRLLRNLGLNPELRGVVTPYALGLGRAPGELRYTEEMDNRGNGRLSTSGDTVVPVARLDDLAGQLNLSQLDFIKMDVEGMELDVLEGARQILERFRPVLCFETIYRRRSAETGAAVTDSTADLFVGIEQLLTGLGYRLHDVDPELTFPAVTAVTLGKNTLAIPIPP
jgi:FkbM family methyltransferase